MEKLKILIADDSAVYRRVLSEAVEGTGLGIVARTASNGVIALEWLRQSDFDVVLLDLFMPELDGIETLRAIKKEKPETEVIMISSLSTDNAEVTLKALELGAIDFIVKPSESSYEKNMDRVKNFLKVLLTQIQVRKCNSSANRAMVREPVKPQVMIESRVTHHAAGQQWTGADLVVIASSTGGPAALETVFSGMNPNFNKPILIVQHMPPEFTRILAETLEKKYHLKVVEGSEGMPVREGQTIIAPGGYHMEVQDEGKSKVIRLKDTPYVNGVRPAADVLFNSVAKAYEGKRVLSVVLTGMGSDGAKGVAELKQRCKCRCITQSESSCVVYGMPRSVFEAGLSDEVADLKDVSKRIQQLV
ncbi:MAG: chemotaxis-specific protein-glutamate methyltransferase CheB [Clostridia bacterium]|nr:chemotaxis-specific protein-glutamate methyltransferase CheB [Clostridia bacterium]